MKDKVESKKKAPHWLPEVTVIGIGAVITAVTFLVDRPEEWGPYLATSLGLLFMMCGVISFLLQHVLSNTTKEIISRMDWRWSFDPRTNWKCAQQIINAAMQDGQCCYETSSIANVDSYEKIVRQLADVWKHVPEKKQVFTRIFCFNDNSRDAKEIKCRQMFHQILEPAQDKENKYGTI